MILGIGTDFIETARVGRAVAKSNGFRKKHFSPAEIAYCEGKRGKAQNYAARFAAKEAFFKAIGTGWRGEFSWNEVEVVNDRLGKPGIVLRGRARDFCRKYRIRAIHVSLTHIKDYSSAVVVMER
ncbi:MAG: holo-[acyl-carrier-protein] synthase [Elusimicrobia bacterium GWA2_69_24]|nr:MAG: holo-[acyl-carrier-protein] synthase [Elusimicrobia bacterium GWA2_69_24]HBL15831.1 holo-[acyl-carrier-protein] synthase [Elusimicrobiota bacterium]